MILLPYDLSLKRNSLLYITTWRVLFFFGVFLALPHRCCKNLLSPAELTDQIFLSLFVLFLVACYSCSYELWCLNFYFKSHSCRKLCFLFVSGRLSPAVLPQRCRLLSCNIVPTWRKTCFLIQRNGGVAGCRLHKPVCAK